MAEEPIKYDAVFEFQKYQEALKSVMALTQKFGRETIAVLDAINQTLLENRGDTAKEIDATTKAIIESTKQRKLLAAAEEAEYIAQEALNRSTLAELKLKIAEQKEIDKSTKAKKAEEKAIKDQTSAYKQASARLNELRARYKDLAIEGKATEKELKALKNEVQALDERLKEVDADTGQYTRHVGDYSNAINAAAAGSGEFGTILGSIQDNLRSAKEVLTSAVADIKNFGEGFKNAEGGINKAKKAVNLFGNALKVSGIAIAIAALASLAAYFKTTEEGGDALGKAIARVQAYIGELVRTLAKAGPFIIGIFQDIYKVGNAVFQSLAITGKVFISVIKGVGKALADPLNAAKALEQTTKDIGKSVDNLKDSYTEAGNTNFKENIEGITSAFDGLFDRFEEAGKKSDIVFDLFDELEERQIRYAQQLQNLQAEETRLAAQSGDLTTAYKDRKKAQEELEKVSTALAQKENQIAREEFLLNRKKIAMEADVTEAALENALLRGKAEGQVTVDRLKALNEFYLKAKSADDNLKLQLEENRRTEREVEQKQILTREKILQESVEVELAAIKAVADASNTSFDVRSAAIQEFGRKNAEAFEAEVKLINDVNNSVIDPQKLIDLSGEALDEYIKSLGIAGDKIEKELSDIANKQKKNRAEQLASEKKLADDIEKIRIREANAQNKIEQEDFKRSIELQDQLTADLKEQLSRRTIDALNASYALRSEALTEQAEFELKNADLTAKERLAIEQKLQNDLARLEDKRREDVEKTERDIRNKRLENIQKTADKVVAETVSELERINKKREEYLNKEIEQRTANIEVAQRRFEEGLSNQLDFEQKKLAEAELARKDAERKAAQQREVLDLIQATYQAYIARLKEPNSNPSTAASQALADTLLIKAGAKLVAGAFFEGTERVEDDLKGNKVHSGRDGYHIAVDGKERIMTGEQNNLIPRWMDNDMLANIAYDFSKGNLASGTAQNIYSSLDLQPLIGEIKGLRQDINKLPRESVDIDSFGRVVKTVIEGSLKTVTKQNKSLWK